MVEGASPLELPEIQMRKETYGFLPRPLSLVQAFTGVSSRRCRVFSMQPRRPALTARGDPTGASPVLIDAPESHSVHLPRRLAPTLARGDAAVRRRRSGQLRSAVDRSAGGAPRVSGAGTAAKRIRGSVATRNPRRLGKGKEGAGGNRRFPSASGSRGARGAERPRPRRNYPTVGQPSRRSRRRRNELSAQWQRSRRDAGP